MEDLHSSPNIVRVIKRSRIRWAMNIERVGEIRNAYKIVVGKPDKKRPLGRRKRRWRNNIKMGVK
jgi:hypothetical protein